MKHPKKFRQLCEYYGWRETLAHLHAVPAESLDEAVTKLSAVLDAERRAHEARVLAGLGGES